MSDDCMRPAKPGAAIGFLEGRKESLRLHLRQYLGAVLRVGDCCPAKLGFNA